MKKQSFILNCIHGASMILFDKHLENRINRSFYAPKPERSQEMAYKINRTVTINGEKKWIRANSEQEYADKLVSLYSPTEPVSPKKHSFEQYALKWFSLYSEPNIESVTRITYKRQLDNYVIPAMGDLDIEDISVDDIQALFNSIDGAKATKQKVKTVLNMILESAVDDGYLQRNPLHSKKIRIVGADSKHAEEYTISQMQYLVQHIPNVAKEEDRIYLALQALHPLRLEEVLGLKWEDIDIPNKLISIHRAVTHPDRNQPEIKETKTSSSTRVIALSSISASYLVPGKPNDFVLGGKYPYSYTKVRKMCERIRTDIGFEERIVPIRFRTTVLTDIYDQTKDVKATQAAAGHTTPAMTLKYYVKGREEVRRTAAVIDQAYTT